MSRSRSTIACLVAGAALLVAAGHAHAVVGFTPGVTLPTASRPGGAAIADFTRDGRADLAVTVDTPDRVLIFPGNGDGTFGAPQTIQVGGSGAESIIAADLNGDNAPDFVIALHNSNLVRAYINSGSGSFTAGTSVPTGADPHAMTGADLDGDGDMDLITANRDGINVTVIRINAGTLALVGSFPCGAEPRGVAVGDFNGDGVLDLATPNHDSRNLTVLNGTASLSYSIGQTIALSERPEGIVAADFDGDGDADVGVSMGGSTTFNVVRVFTNSGSALTGGSNFNTGGINPSHAAAADLNGDGKPEIIVSNEDSSSVGILENTGSGSISFAPAISLATGTHPEAFAIGDLNGNNRPDIAVPNRDANTTSIFINDAAGGPPVLACPADTDRSGALSVDDIFMYLNRWFAGDQRADFNNSNTITVDDVFDYLTAWFNGC